MPTILQRLQLAREHHRAGRHDDAEAVYRAILAERPRHSQALHQLGMLAHQRGRHEDALELIGQALASGGPHPMLYSGLATVSVALNRLDDAEQHCQAALTLQPALASAHYVRGVVLHRRGRLPEAEEAFREAVRVDPRQGDARRRLEGQPAEQLFALVAQLRMRVAAEPDDYPSQRELGLALLARGEAAAALEHLRAATRLGPDVVEGHVALAVALERLDQIDGAVTCYRQALRLDPTNAHNRCSLGYALQTRGAIVAARAEFLTALEHEPGNSHALAALSKLASARYHDFSEGDVQRMEALAARPDLDNDNACRLHFALAHALERAGAYDAAFEHARRANALRCEMDRAAGAIFDALEHRRLIDRLITEYVPEHFQRVGAHGDPSPLPVFVVGMMRSGTTLAEQILASHPLVHGAGELRDFPRLGARVMQMDAAAARAAAEQHLRKLQAHAGSAIRVVDKNPLNYINLGAVATLFPRATIIHCRREPLDTCVSCFFENFNDPFPYKHDLAQLGAYYREYERLMAHWRTALPLPLFELQYEELTADPEGVSRRLVAFCGLDWDARCLRFYETERSVRSASWLQVRQPMYRSSVGRWKHYEKQLQPLIAACGLAAGGAANPASAPSANR
jgi:tetratricopeptide (TPR) repeat protein